MKSLFKRSETIPAILFIAVFIFAALQNRFFLDGAYLLDTTSLYAEGALLAIAMTFVIISGNIDLSVASTMALVACTIAKLGAAGIPMPLACLIGLVVGIALGCINGALVAYAKLPSFLVTLGTMAFYRGTAQAMMGSSSERLPASFPALDRIRLAVIHFPVPLIIVIVFAIFFGLLLHQTNLGRWVFSVGTNERASFFAGVPVDRVKFGVFALAGLMAAIAAILIDSRLGVARFDHARGLELDVITATVLGGVSISGGKGSILGTMIAVLLIAVIRTAMGLANVTAEVQMTVVGSVMIASVALSTLLARTSRTR